MHVLAKKFLRFLFWTIRLFVNPVIYLLNFRGKKTVPPITNPLLKISAKKLAVKIREGEVNHINQMYFLY